MAKKKWFDSGEEAFARDLQRDQEQKSRRAGLSFFKLPVGGSGRVTVLDDAKHFVRVHNFKKGERYYKKICSGDFWPCAYCRAGIDYANMWIAGTIINHTGFRTNDGREIQHFKQVLALKGDAKKEMIVQRDRLKEILDKKGKPTTNPLAFTVWDIRRGSEKTSINTGSHFDLVGRMSKAKLRAQLEEKGVERDDWDEYLAPLNYEETFMPETEEEACRFLEVPLPKRVGSVDTVDDEDDEPSADDSIDSAVEV
jgi:hypothetical protein